MRLLAAVFLLTVAVGPALAHHPFTPYYDASTLVSLTGVVDELRNINPHIVLIVEGTLPDGPAVRMSDANGSASGIGGIPGIEGNRQSLPNHQSPANRTSPITNH